MCDTVHRVMDFLLLNGKWISNDAGVDTWFVRNGIERVTKYSVL